MFCVVRIVKFDPFAWGNPDQLRHNVPAQLHLPVWLSRKTKVDALGWLTCDWACLMSAVTLFTCWSLMRTAGHPTPMSSTKAPLRLAEALDGAGKLTRKGAEKLIDTIDEFAKIAKVPVAKT